MEVDMSRPVKDIRLKPYGVKKGKGKK